MALPPDLVSLLRRHLSLSYLDEHHILLRPAELTARLGSLTPQLLPELNEFEQQIYNLTLTGEITYSSQLFVPATILINAGLAHATANSIILDIIRRNKFDAMFMICWIAALRLQNLEIASWLYLLMNAATFHDFLLLYLSDYFPQPFTDNFLRRAFAKPRGSVFDQMQKGYAHGTNSEGYFLRRVMKARRGGFEVTLDSSQPIDSSYEQNAALCNIRTATSRQDEHEALHYLSYRAIKQPSPQFPAYIRVTICGQALLQSRAGPMRDFVLQSYPESPARQKYLAQLAFILNPTTAETTEVEQDLLILFGRTATVVAQSNFYPDTTLILLSPDIALIYNLVKASTNYDYKPVALAGIIATAAIRGALRIFAPLMARIDNAWQIQISTAYQSSSKETVTTADNLQSLLRIQRMFPQKNFAIDSSYLLQYLALPVLETTAKTIVLQFEKSRVYHEVNDEYVRQTWQQLGVTLAAGNFINTEEKLQTMVAELLMS